ncbi:MAG TPA: AMP-binding protein [Lichenihabitans sp.]|nr:AMP-binding protein [Lichenihabitans sp.]
MANGLVGLGVEHGDYVVIMAESSEDSICTWLGIQLAGAVEVAINTGYRGSPLVHAMQNSQAKVLFIAENLMGALAQV